MKFHVDFVWKSWNYSDLLWIIHVFSKDEATLMKVLFLQSLSYPFVGIMSISAVLRENGHSTKLHILNMRSPTQRDFDVIRDYDPQIVGIPVYTGWHFDALSFSRQLKDRMNVTIVMGAAHASYYPPFVKNQEIDFSCIGEGEVSFLELVNRMEKGENADNIPGIWLTKNGQTIDNGYSTLPELEKLPPMDIDLYLAADENLRKDETREFNQNRGCPFKCTYCNSPSLTAMFGVKSLRTKTIDQCMEELHYVMDRAPYKVVNFTSDNLFVKKDFAHEFLDAYKREFSLPFNCQMRVELVDADIARHLRDAGCHMVTFGVESGSFRVRKEILSRPMPNEKIIKAAAQFKEQGIKVNTNNIMAIPGETFDEAWETLQLNSEIKPTTSWSSIFQPYPGSALTVKLIGEGLITEAIYDKIPASYFEKSVVPLEKAYRFINLQRLFQVAVMYPRLRPVIRLLCHIPFTRTFDIVFLWSFYRYVRFAYEKSRWDALTKVLRALYETVSSARGQQQIS